MPSQAYIEYLLSAGRLEEALECLLVVTLGTDRYDEVIQQSDRYQELRWYERGGLHSDSTLELRRNRIHHALAAITDRAFAAQETARAEATSSHPRKSWREYLHAVRLLLS